MALSSHGLLFMYRGGAGEEKEEEKKRGMKDSSRGFCGSRVSSLSDGEEKIIPLLFLKIESKYSLLLITVQPLNGLNEQVGVAGYPEQSVAVIWSLRTENQTEKRNNLSPTASAHATAITGTLTRTLDRQTKREKPCSVGVG